MPKKSRPKKVAAARSASAGDARTRKRKSRTAGRRLTPRQLQILTFIRDFQRSHGYSPTMQELAEHFHITKVTVFEHVDALVEKNLLRRAPHKARSLELTADARLPDDRPTRIPCVGRIAAGYPIDAVEQAEVLDLEELFKGRGTRFVLQVTGDSMIDEHIRDGDWVVAEQRSQIRNGDTVVALLDDGEATLKQFFREDNRVRLQPANPEYEPIFPRDVNIQGVVVGVIRRY